LSLIKRLIRRETWGKWSKFVTDHEWGYYLLLVFSQV